MNRRFLPLLLVLVLCVIGVGFMRGWFSLTTPRTESNQININLAVDPERAKQDAQALKEKTTGLTGSDTR